MGTALDGANADHAGLADLRGLLLIQTRHHDRANWCFVCKDGADVAAFA